MEITGYKDKHEWTNKNGVTSVVYLMDCMELLKQVPDKYFELAICDVPYGINLGNMPFLKEVNTTVKQKNGSRLNGNKRKKPYMQKDWDNKVPNQDYFDLLQKTTLNQIIFGADYAKWSNMGAGRVKWDKGVADGMSFNRYEVAYCSLVNYEVNIELLWAGMCQAKNLSEPMTQQGNKKLNEKRIHPCHKPILLYLKLIKDYAKPNDKILDTHLGSGSSRIAADKANLPFVACELDADYFYASVKRFKEYSAQQTMF